LELSGTGRLPVMHFGMTGMIMVSLPFLSFYPPSSFNFEFNFDLCCIYLGNLLFEKDEELLLRC
jgi:hypothetical protein